MTKIARSLFAVSLLALAAQASAQVTLYERDGFEGRSFNASQRVGDLQRSGFNDRASSVVVVGQRWQACEDVRFDGRCTVLRPGRYASLGAMGLNDRVSSIRPLPDNERIAESDYAPLPVVTQDFRRRRNERVFDAEVTSARAVVANSGQRCWVEREQVPGQQQGNLNLPGAAVGALIGGILGHQVGGGSGKQIATVGGAVGGAALGAQYGKGGNAPAQMQDVRRCETNPAQATPAYWDVTYQFKGQEHRIQTARDPGRTIPVNGRGEPRV